MESHGHNDHDDEAAVERVLSGDATAFSAIVERWQAPLINLAFRFCRDRTRAEDMAQEAFLRVFRGLGSWRRDAAFSTWLFALATNVYRDEMRRFVPEWVAVEDDLPSSETPVAGIVEEASRRDIVHRAVQSLPSRYRDVILLYHFHEQNVALAAGTLGLPEGTVKARLSRGRAMLASKLENRI